MTTLLAQSDNPEAYLRGLWLLLFLTAIGFFGVILLVLARRAYRRQARLSDRSAGAESQKADAWSESARRIEAEQDEEHDD
ncbi:MAG: hypothetical protein ACYTF7_07355 [Planctomycetota bacterium]|jgi:hypothetical protein